MAEHLPYYGHEQGCYNSRIPWGPEPCSGCVSLRRAFSEGQRDERERIKRGINLIDSVEWALSPESAVLAVIDATPCPTCNGNGATGPANDPDTCQTCRGTGQS